MKTNRRPSQRTSTLVHRYGVALLAVSFASLLWLFGQQIGDATSYLVATTFVLLITWYRGLRWGLVSALLAALLVGFIGPSHHRPIGGQERLVRAAVFLLMAGVVCGIIEAHQRATRKLRESEARFRATYEYAAIGIEQVALDARVLDVNPKLCEILGYPREELLACTSDQITHPADLTEERQHLSRLLAGEIPSYTLEKRYIRKNGEPVWVRLTSSLTGNADAAGTYRISVVEDISEQRRAREALRFLADELREADRQKDAFLAMLGHELRTPLAVIINALELLRRQRGGMADPERVVERIERQAGRIARLIDDMQDLTRISRGSIFLRRAPLDLARLVRETVEDQRSTFEQAGLTLAVELPAAPVAVDGDPDRLAQVLTNLLNNAVKFTDPGGRITVRLMSDTEWATLTVEDTGIGIDVETLPHVFQSFVQAEGDLERARGGLGLGLSLVKGLVELHGGEVGAASAGRGHGAELKVRLPLARSERR